MGLSEMVVSRKDKEEGREPCRCWEGHSLQGEQPVQRSCGTFEKNKEVRGTGVNRRESGREEVNELNLPSWFVRQ